MIQRTLILKDRYLDSVVLMALAGRLKAQPGVEEASAQMGTEANLALLREAGLLDEAAAAAGPTDLVVAVVAADGAQAEQALEQVEELLQGPRPGGAAGARDPAGAPAQTTEEALSRLPEASVALISLPGAYVLHEGLRALDLGLHLFVFSDNVPVAAEVQLKELGRQRGLLVMGPDCGTSILDGVAMGFANVVPRGPVGIIGASGTGIQELSCLLARRGVGVHQAIGVGGRDLSAEVGARSMLQALELLDGDPAVEVIVLLSKPPDPAVAERVFVAAAAAKTRCVLCLLGGDPAQARAHGLAFAARLDDADRVVAALLDGAQPDAAAPVLSDALKAQAAAAAAALEPSRHKVVGLFSGGTLRSEARQVLSEELGVPLEALAKDVVPDSPGQHVLLDLGDDRYTQGRPHPMIDFSERQAQLRATVADPSCAVVLLDCVLGHGAHADPAGELAPLLSELRSPGGPCVVASVTGTAADPQPYGPQRARLESAGVVVLESNAEAARFTAAILQAAQRKEQP